jgi:hypothetical protein
MRVLTDVEVQDPIILYLYEGVITSLCLDTTTYRKKSLTALLTYQVSVLALVMC